LKERQAKHKNVFPVGSTVMDNKIISKKTAKSAQKRVQNFAGATISLTSYYNDGYECKLLKRKGNVGLFEQFTDSGKPVAFELIIIRSNKRKEFPPKTEQWGALGWSFSRKKLAIDAFERLAAGIV
jgi:hypothetical protein